MQLCLPQVSKYGHSSSFAYSFGDLLNDIFQQHLWASAEVSCALGRCCTNPQQQIIHVVRGSPTASTGTYSSCCRPQQNRQKKGRANPKGHASGQGASLQQQKSGQHHSITFATPAGLLFSGDSLKNKKAATWKDRTWAKERTRLGKEEPTESSFLAFRGPRSKSGSFLMVFWFQPSLTRGKSCAGS